MNNIIEKIGIVLYNYAINYKTKSLDSMVETKEHLENLSLALDDFIEVTDSDNEVIDGLRRLRGQIDSEISDIKNNINEL